MLAIYLHHIRKGVDPELRRRRVDAPDADDLKRRRKNMQRGRMPHVVAEEAGEVVGYAYAVLFRKRPAYRYTVKHSIYVRNDHLGRGIGRMLLAALIDACAAARLSPDDRLYRRRQRGLARLHESFGFQRGRRLPSVGYKFGHWTDSVMVQRSLGLGATAPPER